MLRLLLVILIKVSVCQGTSLPSDPKVTNNQTMLFTAHGTLIRNAIKANKAKELAGYYPKMYHDGNRLHNRPVPDLRPAKRERPVHMNTINAKQEDGGTQKT